MTAELKREPRDAHQGREGRRLARDGAPGGARDQEPADADQAVDRPAPARARREQPRVRPRSSTARSRLIARQVETMREIASDFHALRRLANAPGPQCSRSAQWSTRCSTLNAAWAEELRRARAPRTGPGGACASTAGELRRVLINLVSNALEAMPERRRARLSTCAARATASAARRRARHGRGALRGGARAPVRAVLHDAHAPARGSASRSRSAWSRRWAERSRSSRPSRRRAPRRASRCPRTARHEAGRPADRGNGLRRLGARARARAPGPCRARARARALGPHRARGRARPLASGRAARPRLAAGARGPSRGCSRRSSTTCASGERCSPTGPGRRSPRRELPVSPYPDRPILGGWSPPCCCSRHRSSSPRCSSTRNRPRAVRRARCS